MHIKKAASHSLGNIAILWYYKSHYLLLFFKQFFSSFSKNQVNSPSEKLAEIMKYAVTTVGSQLLLITLKMYHEKVPRKIDLFMVSGTILLGKQTAKIAVNLWEKLKVWCPTSWKWLTFWVFWGFFFLVKFTECTCRFAVRQGIALSVFHTNVSRFSC